MAGSVHIFRSLLIARPHPVQRNHGTFYQKCICYGNFPYKCLHGRHMESTDLDIQVMSDVTKWMPLQQQMPPSNKECYGRWFRPGLFLWLAIRNTPPHTLALWVGSMWQDVLLISKGNGTLDLTWRFILFKNKEDKCLQYLPKRALVCSSLFPVVLLFPVMVYYKESLW